MTIVLPLVIAGAGILFDPVETLLLPTAKDTIAVTQDSHIKHRMITVDCIIT